MVFEECHLLDTGYCLTPEFVLFKGGRPRVVRCHCLVALLKHPTEGWGLWDTGYAPRFLEATHRFPYRLYRWATPLPKQADRSVLSQLADIGLVPDQIAWIVLSHLHGDHTAGLRDFPGARLIATRAAYDYAVSKTGLAAVRKAYLPALLPANFVARAQFIDDFTGPAVEGLGTSADLFGDGSARLFPLPGHARGQMGLLAATARGPILFAADSVMHRTSIREGTPPGGATRLISDDPDEVLPTIRRLRAFTLAHPEVPVYPTHCPETYQEVLDRQAGGLKSSLLKTECPPSRTGEAAVGLMAAHFLRANWRWRALRGDTLERFQNTRAREIVEFARTHSAYHRRRLGAYSADRWRKIPAIGKPEMMANFSEYNTANVELDEAMETALRAEETRDFVPTVRGLTVGLSSGTSGHRGLFLVHPREQAAWAGLMLARALPGFRVQGYRVALFLRSNSNLYERIGSRWLTFRYFDLMLPVLEAIEQLNAFDPDIVVGPPSLLGFLADARESGALRRLPLKIISAAEVLEPQDRARLEDVFQQPIHQIYQCTEGLLAMTCAHNRLHIQEDLVAMQLEPLPSEDDEGAARFVPVVTDLWRKTQPIIRYRMNDIVTMDTRACPCGSEFRIIDRIEGRCDDILYFEKLSGGLRPFFPDTIRRMALLASDQITDYQAIQREPGQLDLHILAPDTALDMAADAVCETVRRTVAQYGCRPPRIRVEHGLLDSARDVKRRRVRRLYEEPSVRDAVV